MGITGLIPFLEKATKQVHIKELANTTVAIDTYCWLHRGTVCCAEKIMRGEKTDQYVQFCLKQLQALLVYNIKPILVFDGRHLPAKKGVEEERRKSRKEAKQKAKSLIAEGRMSEARNYLQRAIDISHEMALELIQECRKLNIDCIVAPYEADGQLAYLNLSGIADVVITEDSDLVLFGCKKVLFKYNCIGGLLYDADKLHLTMGCRPDKFTFDKFRAMCILSGCDYLKSLPGIGLAKAKKFFLLTEETDMKKALGKVPNYLNMKQLVVTEEYKDSFLKAISTFRHMVVFNPKTRKLTRLHEVEETIDETLLENAGDFFETETAFQLALGNIDPFSMRVLDDWCPDTAVLPSDFSLKSFKHISIWGPRKNIFSLSNPKKVVDQNGMLKRLKASSHEETASHQEQDIMDLYKSDSPPLKRLKTDSISEEKPVIRNPFKKDTILPKVDCVERTEITESTSLVKKSAKIVSSFFVEKKVEVTDAEKVMMEMIREKLRHTEKKTEVKMDKNLEVVNLESSQESNTSLNDSLMAKLEPTVTIDEEDEVLSFSEKENTTTSQVEEVKAVRPMSRPSGLSRNWKKNVKRQSTLSSFGFISSSKS